MVPLFAPRMEHLSNVKLASSGSVCRTRPRREATALVRCVSADVHHPCLVIVCTSTNWVGSVGEAVAGWLVLLVGVSRGRIPVELVLPESRCVSSARISTRYAGAPRWRSLEGSIVGRRAGSGRWQGGPRSPVRRGGAVGNCSARSPFVVFDDRIVPRSAFVVIGLRLISSARRARSAGLVNWV